jgi:hypothetical protein
MALVELQSAGNIKFTKLSGSAHHELICGWDEALTLCPKPGQSHPEFPKLRVTDVEFVPEGPAVELDAFGVGKFELRRILVDYAFNYRDIPLGGEPVVTRTGTTQVLNTCAGRVRATSRIPIDIEDLTQATIYSQSTINVDCAVSADPEPSVLPLQGTCNDAPFAVSGSALYFPTATLMLMDYEVQQQYDYDTEAWYYRLTYKMMYVGLPEGTQHTWNEVYFPPVYERDPDTGNIQYYQDVNAAKTATYVAHTSPRDPLVNTPVYQVDASVGIWEETDPLNYVLADWSALPLQDPV